MRDRGAALALLHANRTGKAIRAAADITWARW